MLNTSQLIDKFYTFEKNNSRLFSFEGIEGSGKSTQIQILKNYLTDLGYEVLLLREPGGTSFGEGLRSAILNSSSPLTPISEAYLFASSRAQLIQEKILPFLENEKHIVILDRYIDSSMAYQGNARGLGMDTILNIHSISPLNIMPNKTFYLSITMEESMRRQDSRGNQKDYFEKENQDFYLKLIEGYENCADKFTDRIIRVDASRPIEEVSATLLDEMKKLL
jgi:dTMP kinase